MISTEKSKGDRVKDSAWRDFLSAMLTFDSERTKNESVSEIMNEGLKVFLCFPGANSASLFLFDQDTAEFHLSSTIPPKEPKKVEDIFNLLVEENGLAEALETGNIVLWKLKNGAYKEKPVFIIPLVSPVGITGVVILQCKENHFALEQLMISLCKLHSNQYASLLYSVRLVKKINGIQSALEQKIVLRTKKIEQSERELKAVIDSVQTGIMIIDKENNKVLDANLAAQQITGISKEKLIGHKRRDFGIMQEPESFLNGNLFDKSGNLECLLKRADGSFVPILRTVSNVSIGEKDCYLVSFMDITERKQSEKALVESEKHFRTIFEKAGTGMALTGLDGKIIEANKAFLDMLGYSENELKMYTFADLTYPDDIDKDQEESGLTENSDNESYQFQTQKRYVHKSGRIVWGKLTSTLIHHADGKPKLGLGMVEDITEQKLSEEALIKAKDAAEEASRMKSSLMANMSHELRTPMNGILGFSQILNEELSDPFLKDMNMKILASGKRLMNTINSILDLSLLESSVPKINIEEYDLMDILGAFSGLYKNLASEKNIDFNLIMEEDNIFIRTDKRLFEQIINNLLDNAIKYTEKGNVTITISIKEENDSSWGVFCVSDTGIGISKNYYDFIYDAFRQVSEGIGRRYEGSGLGLTLVKKMVRLLNGQIFVESELGKGSVFTVILPGVVKKSGNDAYKEKIEQKIKSHKSGKRPSILLVEDNAINQDVATIFLKDLYDIEQTEDGISAIKMASLKTYDAILMDINLGPGITGVEAAGKIKTLPGYKKVPIIAITGYAMTGDKERLIEQGMTYYLPKPFDREQIINILKEALKNRG
jgi:PAS domain S-box-containing protein